MSAPSAEADIIMCEEQRADLRAAQEGKITWRQYCAKWGRQTGLHHG